LVAICVDVAAPIGTGAVGREFVSRLERQR
jgi:hypothetical protein